MLGDKIQRGFWRPITGIRAAAGDGNNDTVEDFSWTPLGAQASNKIGPNFTPPFPAYSSGHATFGAAMFQTYVSSIEPIIFGSPSYLTSSMA